MIHFMFLLLNKLGFPVSFLSEVKICGKKGLKERISFIYFLIDLHYKSLWKCAYVLVSYFRKFGNVGL